MTIKGLLRKAEDLQAKYQIAIVGVFVDNVTYLGILNKQQLLAGRRSDGQEITPGYLEDPYFKTRAQAQAYSDWKDRITPNPLRRPGVPNLFINGYYHDSRHITILGEKIIYHADYKGEEIEQKYGDEINGVGGDFKVAFLQLHIRPSLQVEFTNIIGLKFNK